MKLRQLIWKFEIKRNSVLLSLKYKGWKQFDTSHLALFTGYNIYVPSILSLPLFITFLQMIGRRPTPSARPCLLMFRIGRPIKLMNSSHMLSRVPHSGSFTFGEEIVNAWTNIGWIRLIFQNLLLPAAQEFRDSSSDMTPCIVMKNDGFCTTKFHHFLVSAGRMWCSESGLRWCCRKAGTCSSRHGLLGGTAWCSITSSMSYATMNITFTALCVGSTFCGREEPGCFHSFDWRFKLDSYDRAQVSSIACQRI